MPFALNRVAVASLLAVVLASSARAQDATPAPPNVPLGEPATSAAAATSTAPLDVVTRFYNAFEVGDFNTLEKLYAPDVHWQDTIFSYTGRENVMGVWRFEIYLSKGGKISYKIVSTEGNTVVVSWSDDYSFFGEPVSHAITATLVVENGQIVRHTEDYSWDEWAKQAFPYLKSFPETPVGKAVVEGALRAFVYTYVPIANLYARLRGAFQSDDKDKTDAAKPDAPSQEPPRTGMSQLLQRRVAESGPDSDHADER